MWKENRIEGRTKELSNAIACGYVTKRNGKYVKAESEPDWKHPSLRTPEENKQARIRAGGGRY